jgi:hypothetical protein
MGRRVTYLERVQERRHSGVLGELDVDDRPDDLNYFSFFTVCHGFVFY